MSLMSVSISHTNTPITRVNSTNDPRVIWEDGLVAIIEAGDFPEMSGMGRSKTRDTVVEAIGAAIDPGLQTGVGAGSVKKLIKVNLAELLARPPNAPGTAGPPVPVARLPLDPRDFRRVSPVIARSGSYAGKVIPDFPHTCVMCGGPYYQGNFSSVHPTEDGACPSGGGGAKPKPRRR